MVRYKGPFRHFACLYRFFKNKPSPPQGAGYSPEGLYRSYRRKRRGIRPVEIKFIFLNNKLKELDNLKFSKSTDTNLLLN
jgi:hypothetical protein